MEKKTFGVKYSPYHHIFRNITLPISPLADYERFELIHLKPCCESHTNLICTFLELNVIPIPFACFMLISYKKNAKYYSTFQNNLWRSRHQTFIDPCTFTGGTDLRFIT